MRLKIAFEDFYWDFNKDDNYFINILRRKYIVELSDSPQILFYGNYGFNHLKYNCLKIFYASENTRPNYKYCDYSMSFDYTDNKKNYRLPLFLLHGDIHDLTISLDIEKINKEKNKFCNFIYSNPRAQERIEFFNILNKYKKVDSPGNVSKNVFNGNAGMRYDYKAKKEYIRDFKFTIAFENESYPGYTTEKIIHAMQVNSIPIYWGNPRIADDFNSKSFINVHEFQSFGQAAQRIMEIDKDEDLYISYLQEPFFKNNIVPPEFKEKAILNFLDKVILHSSKPISKSILGRYNRLQKLFILFLRKHGLNFKNAVVKFTTYFKKY